MSRQSILLIILIASTIFFSFAYVELIKATREYKGALIRLSDSIQEYEQTVNQYIELKVDEVMLDQCKKDCKSK